MDKSDSKIEQEKGRLPLWLDPEDIAFICDQWRRIPENISENDRETWSRIGFRSMTALHKNGINYTANFPKEHEKYRLKKDEKV